MGFGPQKTINQKTKTKKTNQNGPGPTKNVQGPILQIKEHRDHFGRQRNKVRDQKRKNSRSRWNWKIETEHRARCFLPTATPASSHTAWHYHSPTSIFYNRPILCPSFAHPCPSFTSST